MPIPCPRAACAALDRLVLSPPIVPSGRALGVRAPDSPLLRGTLSPPTKYAADAADSARRRTRRPERRTCTLGARLQRDRTRVPVCRTSLPGRGRGVRPRSSRTDPAGCARAAAVSGEPRCVGRTSSTSLRAPCRNSPRRHRSGNEVVGLIECRHAGRWSRCRSRKRRSIVRTTQLSSALAAAALLAAAPVTSTAGAAPQQVAAAASPGTAAAEADARLERLKEEASASVDDRHVLIPAHDRQPVQLLGARVPGVRDPALHHGAPRRGRLRDRARGGRHPERLDRPLGFGAPRDRARQRRRRHPAVVPGAGRGLPGTVDRRRAGARRGPQLGPGGEHRRGARGEGDHGAGRHPRHPDDLAGDCGGAARREGALRPRRHLRRRRHRAVQPHQQRHDDDVGRQPRQRDGVGRVPLRGRVGPRGRRPLERPERARRGRADEHRVELPPRAPAHSAALALCHHRRRRPAQRGASDRERLVLLPRRPTTRTSCACGASGTPSPRARP